MFEGFLEVSVKILVSSKAVLLLGILPTLMIFDKNTTHQYVGIAFCL